ELRKKARSFIDAALVLRAVGKKDAEMILEFVRTGELTHPQKSWALIQAAKLLTKTDRDRSLGIIEDATAEARRIEELDAARPRALMNVANALLPLDRAKDWDMAYDAVKAAKSSAGYTGEDGVSRRVIPSKEMSRR